MYHPGYIRMFLQNKDFRFLAKRTGIPTPTLESIRDTKRVPIKPRHAIAISSYMAQAKELTHEFNMKVYASKDMSKFLQDKSLETLSKKLGISGQPLRYLRDIPGRTARVSVKMKLSWFMEQSKSQFPKQKPRGKTKPYTNKLIREFLQDKTPSTIVNRSNFFKSFSLIMQTIQFKQKPTNSYTNQGLIS